jgi:hypothetical protein
MRFALALPRYRHAHNLAVWDFCHARPLYRCGTGSDGRGTMAERDLTAREDRFIGLCLVALAIILVFIFILTKS